VALIAETGPDFAALFCACVYAGAWPVPLPLPTTFGGKDSFIDQLAVQLMSSDPKMLLYPPEIAEMAAAAAARQGCEGIDWGLLAARPAPAGGPAEGASPDDICYLQYSSGSTRFPHRRRGHPPGAAAQPLRPCRRMNSARTTAGQLAAVVSRHGPGRLPAVADRQPGLGRLPQDRAFARRPLAWLDLISRNKGNTLSYSPTFGYDICARRISSQSNVAERFDLSRWRLAGNGADMIRPT
jgi:fatty-acyl-CoA synthase